MESCNQKTWPRLSFSLVPLIMASIGDENPVLWQQLLAGSTYPFWQLMPFTTPFRPTTQVPDADYKKLRDSSNCK